MATGVVGGDNKSSTSVAVDGAMAAEAEDELPGLRELLHLLVRDDVYVDALQVDEALQSEPAALFDVVFPLLPYAKHQRDRRLLKHAAVLLIQHMELGGHAIDPFLLRATVTTLQAIPTDDPIYREEGADVLAWLIRVAGADSTVAAFGPDVMDPHSAHLQQAAAVSILSTAAIYCGIPPLLPFLRAACTAGTSPPQTRRTGMTILQRIAAVTEHSHVLYSLASLVDIARHGVEEEREADRGVSMAAAEALAALAEAAGKPGSETLYTAAGPLWRRMRGSNAGSSDTEMAAVCINASTSILRTLDGGVKSYYAYELMFSINNLLFRGPHKNEKVGEVLLVAYKRWIQTPDLKADDLLLHEHPAYFIRCFWPSSGGTVGARNLQLLMEASALLAKKVGLEEFSRQLLDALSQETEMYRNMVLSVVEKELTSIASSL